MVESDITVIILTYNEEKHLARCIKNVSQISKSIYVVDSYSSDSTVDIALSNGAVVYQNKWENNYAKQFNWALSNIPIKSSWVLRLDADEYLLPELIDEIKNKIKVIDDNVSGIVLKRRHYFMGKWIKRGVYPIKLLRIFRYGSAECEQRWMDEHIRVKIGNIIEFDNDFVDHNLQNINWWIAKHNGYAVREAIDLLNIRYNFNNRSVEKHDIGSQGEMKRYLKIKYVKQPLIMRAIFYFIYRYIIQLGFIEGYQGFLWHFFQGLWYRCLVDVIIMDIEKKCGEDYVKIQKYIYHNYNISI
jgi:glycosyltransferase involved in cell wall biosynthesis